jgi:hypothetical protein
MIARTQNIDQSPVQDMIGHCQSMADRCFGGTTEDNALDALAQRKYLPSPTWSNSAIPSRRIFISFPSFGSNFGDKSALKFSWINKSINRMIDQSDRHFQDYGYRFPM